MRRFLDFPNNVLGFDVGEGGTTCTKSTLGGTDPDLWWRFW